MFFTLPLPSQVKVSVLNRVVAKVIDLIFVFSLALILPNPLGPLVGFLYSISADGLPLGNLAGQSIGKRLMKLQVIDRKTCAPATFKASALRNAPVGVATVFAIIPVWGWLILILIGVPLMMMEVYLMISVDSGHRLGDVMGDTEVIELPKG